MSSIRSNTSIQRDNELFDLLNLVMSLYQSGTTCFPKTGGNFADGASGDVG